MEATVSRTVLRARKLSIPTADPNVLVFAQSCGGPVDSFTLTIHGVRMVLKSIRLRESLEGPSPAHSEVYLCRSSATCRDADIRFHQQYFADKPSIPRIHGYVPGNATNTS